MARNRRAGGFSSSSSSTSHAAPPPARTPAPAPHSNHNTSGGTGNTHHNTQAAQPQAPQVTNVYIQRSPTMGGGGGSGMLGTMAAVAGGSVLGHGISNMIWGRDNAPTQPAQAQELSQQMRGDPCESQITAYSKCLEANPDHSDNCKWAWEHFLQCQRQGNPSA